MYQGLGIIRPRLQSAPKQQEDGRIGADMMPCLHSGRGRQVLGEVSRDINSTVHTLQRCQNISQQPPPLPRTAIRNTLLVYQV